MSRTRFPFLLLALALFAKAQMIEVNASGLVVKNKYYSLAIDKTTGMIESLKMKDSDFELVCDVPAYSLFFPEYLYEPDGSLSHQFNLPPRHSSGVDIQVLENTVGLGVVHVSWDTGQLNSEWTFIFQANLPTFRATITRTVETSGVYSNAQQCVMYSADMDMSYLIDYEGKILTTKGSYEGEYEVEAWQGIVRDDSPTTTTHSLWTVFDYGTPRYLPTFIWWDAEEDITVGVITTWTSENQRSTISYHGGGSSQVHPGFAEGQWNWFGKSDSESLYLTAGTSYSMELIYYQNHGHIDSLLEHLSERINPDAHIVRKMKDYRVASWGGRSSVVDSYFWRYPQFSSNEITSQRLFKPYAIAIPRSQNGMRENQLFSFSIAAFMDGAKLSLTPNFGHEPLFETLGFEQNDSSWIGTMTWIVDGIETCLNYEMPLEGSGARIFGYIQGDSASFEDVDDTALILERAGRSRVEVGGPEMPIRFKARDAILDSIEIGVKNLTGIDSIVKNQNDLRLLLTMDDQNADSRQRYYSFSIQLVPKIYKISDEITAQEYKSYFVKPEFNNNSADIFVEPSADYYCLRFDALDEDINFDVWVENHIGEIYFYTEADMPAFLYEKSSVIRYPLRETAKPNVYKITCALNPGLHSLTTLSESNINGLEMSTIFPNPNHTGEFKINIISDSYQVGKLIIYDIKGEVVESQTIVADDVDFQEIRISLDRPRYSSGLYILKIDFPQKKRIQKFTYLISDR